jgi:hypothetical protein
MRENGHHNRETGKDRQETVARDPATIKPQSAMVTGSPARH